MSTKVNDFEKNLGEMIQINGTVSKVMWQHFTINIDTHPHVNYIDIDDMHQIIVYSKSQIKCKKNVEIVGELIKIENKSKDPRYKIHDEYYEYQLIANSWKCVKRE